MIKTRKDVFRLLVVLALVVCYVIFFTVPYLQTFGQGYTFQAHFHTDKSVLYSYFIPDYPNHCLTLDGRFLGNTLSRSGSPACYSNIICRIPLMEQNFDNLFTEDFSVYAKWLRENTKAAWIGFTFSSDYGKIYLQYILKLNNGDVVVCQSSPLFQKEPSGFIPDYTLSFSPTGTVLEFYAHIGE